MLQLVQIEACFSLTSLHWVLHLLFLCVSFLKKLLQNERTSKWREERNQRRRCHHCFPQTKAFDNSSFTEVSENKQLSFFAEDKQL